jgi:hypothetical protein
MAPNLSPRDFTKGFYDSCDSVCIDRITLSAKAALSWDLDRLISRGPNTPRFFGLRRLLRCLGHAGLRVAYGLRQHLPQLSLRLRRCPRERCLPLSHDHYVGMPEAELNPTGEGFRRHP